MIPRLHKGMAFALGMHVLAMTPGCATTTTHLRIQADADVNAPIPGERGAPVYVLVKLSTPDAFSVEGYNNVEALASQALTGKLPEGVPLAPVRVKPGEKVWVRFKVAPGQSYGVYALFTEARDDGSWKVLMTPSTIGRVHLGRAEILE